MPYIETKVNVPISEEKELVLKKRFGQAIALIPGKSESVLMLSFADNCRMWFAGESGPAAAMVEVKILGKSTKQAFAAVTREIMGALNDELGIDPGRIYVKFEEMEHWGFDGGCT